MRKPHIKLSGKWYPMPEGTDAAKWLQRGVMVAFFVPKKRTGVSHETVKALTDGGGIYYGQLALISGRPKPPAKTSQTCKHPLDKLLMCHDTGSVTCAGCGKALREKVDVKTARNIGKSKPMTELLYTSHT